MTWPLSNIAAVNNVAAQSVLSLDERTVEERKKDVHTASPYCKHCDRKINKQNIYRTRPRDSGRNR